MELFLFYIFLTPFLSLSPFFLFFFLIIIHVVVFFFNVIIVDIWKKPFYTAMSLVPKTQHCMACPRHLGQFVK